MPGFYSPYLEPASAELNSPTSTERKLTNEQVEVQGSV